MQQVINRRLALLRLMYQQRHEWRTRADCRAMVKVIRILRGQA